MTTVGIVGCVKTKPCRAAPAKDLYVSPLFRAARAYCEATYDRWLILSARHGLLEPAAVISPYDETLLGMDHVERFHWIRGVAMQPIAVDLADQARDGEAEIWLHAGALYREAFGHHGLNVPVNLPFGGLAIGQRLAWYAARRAEREEADRG